MLHRAVGRRGRAATRWRHRLRRPPVRRPRRRRRLDGEHGEDGGASVSRHPVSARSGFSTAPMTTPRTSPPTGPVHRRPTRDGETRASGVEPSAREGNPRRRPQRSQPSSGGGRSRETVPTPQRSCTEFRFAPAGGTRGRRASGAAPLDRSAAPAQPVRSSSSSSRASSRAGSTPASSAHRRPPPNRS